MNLWTDSNKACVMLCVVVSRPYVYGPDRMLPTRMVGPYGFIGGFIMLSDFHTVLVSTEQKQRNGNDI